MKLGGKGVGAKHRRIKIVVQTCFVMMKPTQPHTCHIAFVLNNSTGYLFESKMSCGERKFVRLCSLQHEEFQR